MLKKLFKTFEIKFQSKLNNRTSLRSAVFVLGIHICPISQKKIPIMYFISKTNIFSQLLFLY